MILFPETSALMALFNDEDPHHLKAVDIVREYKIRDILIAPTVMVEWRQRSQLEHRALVMQIVLAIDQLRKDSDSKNNFSNEEINVLIEQAENELRKREHSPYDPRKLRNAKVNLIGEIRLFLRTGGSTERTTPKELKRHMLSLRVAWFERSEGTALFLSKNGARVGDISDEVGKKVIEALSKNPTGLADKDEMIFSDLLRYVYTSDDTILFLSGDRDFVKKTKKFTGESADILGKLVAQYIGELSSSIGA